MSYPVLVGQPPAVDDLEGKVDLLPDELIYVKNNRGSKLEVVWAQFSTLGYPVLLQSNYNCTSCLQPLLELNTKPWFDPNG